MPHDDDKLVFPSGRSVSRVRQDAKAMAKAEGIPLNQALDHHALVNTRLWGVRWAEALDMLREDEMPDTFPEQCCKAPPHAELDIYSMASMAPRQYPWDHWERIALERGIQSEIASLGRAVMREYYQHGWSSHAEEVSHRHPRAPSDMLLAAAHMPVAAVARWQYLLVTDGGRVEGEVRYAPAVDVTALRTPSA